MPNEERVPSDEELMVACSQGDSSALDELYRRYQKPLFGFAYRYLRNADLAMDVVQETFLRVHRGREDYRPTAGFSSWLFRITRNLCIDEKRRYWNRQVTQDSQFGSEDQSGPSFIDQEGETGRTGADEIFEDQVSRRIHEAIEELSPEQKEVILLNRYEGMAYKEIGDILGISTESVKQRAYRAHLRLRELLKDLMEAEPEPEE